MKPVPMRNSDPAGQPTTLHCTGPRSPPARATGTRPGMRATPSQRPAPLRNDADSETVLREKAPIPWFESALVVCRCNTSGYAVVRAGVSCRRLCRCLHGNDYADTLADLFIQAAQGILGNETGRCSLKQRPACHFGRPGGPRGCARTHLHYIVITGSSHMRSAIRHHLSCRVAVWIGGMNVGDKRVHGCPRPGSCAMVRLTRHDNGHQPGAVMRGQLTCSGQPAQRVSVVIGISFLGKRKL